MSGSHEPARGPDGILLVDKPAGWTSHDVVARMRRIAGQRKIGHAGTLDPMATGLLVLCLGNATRLVEYMGQHDKAYEGMIRLGTTTTTDDADGEVVRQGPVPALGQGTLERALAAFRGAIRQRPPAFSAVKVGGRRAYAMARAGETPELADREVTIRSLEGSVVGDGMVHILLVCSAGTYVRSLARDLGDALGCGAHLASLRRTRSGQFDVRDAATLDELTAIPPDALAARLIPSDEAIADWPAAVIREDSVAAFAHGMVTLHPPGSGGEGTRTRVFGVHGEFAGVGKFDASGRLRPVKVILHMQ